MLLSALLVALTVPLENAHATSDDAERVETYVLPLNVDAPSTSEIRQPEGLRKLRKLAGSEASQALLPHETIGPAKSYAALSAQDSARPAPTAGTDRSVMADGAISLPEPSHSMTAAECTLGLATSTFYVKSRFAVCSGVQMNQVWMVDGEPVGASHFDVMAIGTIPRDSRTMTITYAFTDFTATGTNAAAGMGIVTEGKIAQSWPSSVHYTEGGVSMPTSRTWAQLLETGGFKHTVSAAAGQGSAGAATDFRLRCLQAACEHHRPARLGGDIADRR